MNGHNSEVQNTGTADPDAAQASLERAIQHHRAGRLETAETAYRKILQTRPEHGVALHMLGLIEYQAGRYEQAIDLMSRAETRIPGDAGLHTNLGTVLQASGRLDEAVSRYMKAIAISPGFALAYNNLGNALRLQGKQEQAVSAFRQALDIDPDYADGYVNLAIAYQSTGETDKAIQCYEKAVALDPQHGPATHMLAALRGEHTTAAPPGHVAHLFDEYAARFDHHLVETLGYSMPGLLRSEIDQLEGKDAHFQNVIDLGCGTGLAGVAFRPLATRLTGVDLSPGMIVKSRERGVYDILHTGDIISTLLEQQEHYDLFICADVFPYIGDVGPLFSALHSRANEHALFAFSTESHTGSDYILRPTGRYAHSGNYLRNAAADHGFSVITMRTENLRKQKDRWIPGDLVILRKISGENV
ncbi:MAG TPA: tetratricopeptide repeat protein [Gammaproteobacteria bacterium]|nr:tetratricopeptide repeat protein [Gammaproteobacteria bacterium]